MGGEPNLYTDADLDCILADKAGRVEELEVAVRAALSFMQDRHASGDDGHAQMVIAALRGALRGFQRD